MTLLAFQVEVVAAKVAEKAGSSLIDYGAIGAVLVISIGLNLLLVWKLMKVQDKRVEDKETDNRRLERLTVTTSEVVAKVSTAVNSFEASDRASAQVLQGVKQSLDTVVMQAVMRRGMTPGERRAVRPDDGGV